MGIDVTMPKLSDTMEEGKVLRWLKQVGDPVAVGDILAEVETDKAEMELEAFDAGVLAEIRTPEGGTVPVGAVIAVLGGEESSVRSRQPAAAPLPLTTTAPSAPRAPAPPRVQPPPPVATTERRTASPLARRIASERGIDLGDIAGTGPGGRVVQRDVQSALAMIARPASPPPAPGRVAAPTGRRVELSRMRRTTARRMAEAKREIPHFYVSAEVGMDEVVAMKTTLAGLGEAYAGITYTHILLKAVGLALARVPEMNAAADGDTIVLHDGVHVGVATAVDDGLIVPVVRDCDRNRLADLVRDARAVIERARAGRFAADDLTGATFTLSNLGMFPVREFAAIINPPQAAILAIGAVRETPVVRQGAVVPGHVMAMTLSCDHRIVDGALAGRFLRELIALLERPAALLA